MWMAIGESEGGGVVGEEMLGAEFAVDAIEGADAVI